ncbi:MAG: DUF1643 domain-containing protein [Eubacteriales bacterium]|nr:DUF1643 domain-containing protein [Eubacteriales bacterium]
MHIPNGSSSDSDILSFENALSLGGKSSSYNAAKWIYVPDFYTEYRYILGTRGMDPLICIGINPSTAEPENLDNTLKSVSRIAAGNGFDSWIMFNVYAQRATRPDDMDKTLNPELHSENMKAFRYILSNVGEGVSPCIWAAWGAIIEKRFYLSGCVREMIQIGREYNARWVSAGKISVKGHPHHPLYLPKDEKIADFDISGYLDKLEARSERGIRK